MPRSARAVTTACLLTTAALALTSCTNSVGSNSAAGASKTLTIATMTLPQSLDPAVATGSALPFFQATYDTLVKRNADGSYAPMLATAWSYNAAQTQLTLTLRTGVTFQDGTAFDAAAVKANLLRFQKAGGADASTLATLKSVDVLDATHVRLDLAAPMPSLLFHLSDSAGLMASPAAFAKANQLNTRPDGTGPYVLDQKSTAFGTKWVYTRNPTYWGTKLPFDTVTMSVFNNETAIVNGLETGQIDTAVLQTADKETAVASDTQLTTTDEQFDFQGLLLFDRGGAVTPALKDVRVRQAVNYALDRATMLNVIRQNLGQVTDQVFGPHTPGYEAGLDTYYSYDPAKAKQLLTQAGYAHGFTLHLPLIPAIVSDALAAGIKSDLGAVGINVVWDSTDASTVEQKIFVQRAYSGMVMNIGQSSDPWVVAQTLVLPGVFNMFGSTDPTVAGLVAKIQSEPAADATADYQALNTHLVQQGWFAPLYRMTYKLVTDKKVKATLQAGMAVPSLYDYTPAQ
ncbi:ABC transporter substrate-binding protein [Streptacidiphilus fuscans]|uniref:ABC transporter substrate-binding protein n=1 Tax=Streptacidiphilus fuscans TaxID=2789292 RepID=A0A931FAK0_9ACTN|nr:ABC transporter substrate-binding protein [Streptacidiphilus fuscans]MBF9066483.1 ABC transporter substrate-binding protein [Streptacidiphilus fuscans]